MNNDLMTFELCVHNCVRQTIGIEKIGSSLKLIFGKVPVKLAVKCKPGHTSPSLVRNNNSSVDLVGEEKQPSGSVDRLPLPNDQFEKNPYPVNLAKNTKSHRNKLSRLKVLLSPRNPYEEFHKLFTDIPKEEFPINDYSCALSRDILLHGRLFASQNWLCFYSNIFGFETVVKLEFKKVKSIARARTAYMFPNAILVRTEKKKYLFCSFLMRDAAHKLLSAVWQESTNNKPDSGVDEVSANGDLDEDESENLEEINDDTNLTEMPIETQQLLPAKDTTLWNLGKHHRTVSCPNTPLSHHPTVDEKREIGETIYLHHKDQHAQKRPSFINSITKYSAKIARASCSLLKSTYNWLSPLEWLFKRNKFSVEIFLLLSSFVLILLLISTYVLMDRISKLEDRFQHRLPAPTSDQNWITDLEQSEDNWSELMKKYDKRYRKKTERFNNSLKELLLSFDNVQSKLKQMKDELGERTDIH